MRPWNGGAHGSPILPTTIWCISRKRLDHCVLNTPKRQHAQPLDPEDVLSRLDEEFGFRVESPNPFPGEIGLNPRAASPAAAPFDRSTKHTASAN